MQTYTKRTRFTMLFIPKNALVANETPDGGNGGRVGLVIPQITHSLALDSIHGPKTRTIPERLSKSEEGDTTFIHYSYEMRGQREIHRNKKKNTLP